MLAQLCIGIGLATSLDVLLNCYLFSNKYCSVHNVRLLRYILYTRNFNMKVGTGVRTCGKF